MLTSSALSMHDSEHPFVRKLYTTYTISTDEDILSENTDLPDLIVENRSLVFENNECIEIISNSFTPNK